MNNNKDDILKQINTDTLFFFLSSIQSLISLYIITEKKKSALKIPSIDNNTANKIYYYNRRLNFIIALYFFINAYYSYKEVEYNDNNKQESLLLIVAFFNLIGAFFYLPLGNSNLIIEE